MIYEERLTRIYKELNELRDRIKEELAGMPEGYLNVRTIEGRHYYTWQLPAEGNRKRIRRKGITKDQKMVGKLVRKKYLTEAKARIEEDIKVVRTAIDHYIPIDEQSVMRDYLEKFPELEAGVNYGKQSDDVWAADYTIAEGLYDENRISISAKGIPMRTRGEIIIAGRLDFYGIPYRYEDQIKHPDIERVPDFTIRRPRDGKIIYWEHFGLVNDEDYMAGNERKLTEFEVNDIVPWDNLIITYDQKDGGIDVKIIDAMIQGWLL